MYIRGKFHGSKQDLKDTIIGLMQIAESMESWTSISPISNAIAYLYDIAENIDSE